MLLCACNPSCNPHPDKKNYYEATTRLLRDDVHNYGNTSNCLTTEDSWVLSPLSRRNPSRVLYGYPVLSCLQICRALFRRRFPSRFRFRFRYRFRRGFLHAAGFLHLTVEVHDDRRDQRHHDDPVYAQDDGQDVTANELSHITGSGLSGTGSVTE